MSLGKFAGLAFARRVALGAVAMTMLAVGLTGAAPEGSGASEVPAAGSTVLLPALTLVAEEPTTTTTLPPETTTTTTAPPPPPDLMEAATTTTTAPPPPPEPAPTTTTTATTAPPRQADSVDRQQTIEAIADESGWNWRAAGVRLVVGYYPQDCCHWGVYESEKKTIWIGPSAFGNMTRLRYVVLHELGHAWQYTGGHILQIIKEYKPWGQSTPSQALEAGGDCIALLWGAQDRHYWTCPADALALTARRLAGDWG